MEGADLYDIIKQVWNCFLGFLVLVTPNSSLMVLWLYTSWLTKPWLFLLWMQLLHLLHHRLWCFSIADVFFTHLPLYNWICTVSLVNSLFSFCFRFYSLLVVIIKIYPLKQKRWLQPMASYSVTLLIANKHSMIVGDVGEMGTDKYFWNYNPHCNFKKISLFWKLSSTGSNCNSSKIKKG